MGFIDTLLGRIPIFIIGIGVILLTGSYRGNQGGFETMPIIGVALVVVGLLLFGGLRVVDLG